MTDIYVYGSLASAKTNQLTVANNKEFLVSMIMW